MTGLEITGLIALYIVIGVIVSAIYDYSNQPKGSSVEQIIAQTLLWPAAITLHLILFLIGRLFDGVQTLLEWVSNFELNRTPKLKKWNM